MNSKLGRDHVVIPLMDIAQIIDFESSSDELTDYLIDNALSDQRELVAATHLLLSNDEIVIGYFSLLNDSIKISWMDKGDLPEGYRYSSIPALKIGRLSCRKGYEGQGIGTEMITLSLSYLFQIIKYSGCRILLVDSKKGCEGFYEIFGFKRASTSRNDFTSMYLDVSSFTRKMQDGCM